MKMTRAKFFQWIMLGWTDIVLEYRRTKIGPLWQTLQVIVLTAGLVVVFGGMRRGIENFPAYVLCGLILWNFISITIIGGGRVFNHQAGLIRDTTAPLELYIVRELTVFTIRMFFQMVAYVLAIFVFDVTINWYILCFIPAIAVYIFTALWLMPMVGIWITRFPDFGPFMQAVMRFLFFLTPVFWGPGGNSMRQYLYLYNPFTHFLNIARQPLLGQPPDAQSWVIVLIFTSLGAMVSGLLYMRKRDFIVYWL